MYYFKVLFVLVLIILFTNNLLADGPQDNPCRLESKTSLCISSNGDFSRSNLSFGDSSSYKYKKFIIIGDDTYGREADLKKITYDSSTLTFGKDSIFIIRDSANITFTNSFIYQKDTILNQLLLDRTSQTYSLSRLSVKQSVANFGIMGLTKPKEDIYTNLKLISNDSVVTITQLNFWSKGKTVDIDVSNRDEKDYLNNLTIKGNTIAGISNQRNIALLGSYKFSGTNSSMFISGDIVGTLSLSLRNAKFLFTEGSSYKVGGNAAPNLETDTPLFLNDDGGLSSLELLNNSQFIMRDGELSFRVSRSTITGNSQFIADQVYVNSGLSNLTIVLGANDNKKETQDDKSIFQVKELVFNPNSSGLGIINFEVNGISSFYVGKLDLSNVVWKKEDISNAYFQAQVAKGANFYVKELIVGPEQYIKESNTSVGSVFKFPSSTVGFGKIVFKQNNFFTIDNQNLNDGIVNADEIYFTANTDGTKGAGNTSGDVFFKFKNITLNVKKLFEIKDVKILDIKLVNSKVKVATFSSSSKGFSLSGDDKSTFESDYLTTSSADEGTLIDNVKSLTVNHKLSASGKFTLKGSTEVNLSNWEGTNVSIFLQDKSILNLKDNTRVTLNDTLTPINIDKDATLNIFGENVFSLENNKESIKVDNKGTFAIMGGNNTFHEVNNNGGLFSIKFNNLKKVNKDAYIGKVINNVINNARGNVELYDKAYIKEMHNNADVNIYGKVIIDKYYQEDNGDNKSYLIFNINRAGNDTNLLLNNSPEAWNKRVKVNIKDTSFIKPGSFNHFDLLSTKGKSGLTEDDLKNKDIFSYLPDWLVLNKGINIDENNVESVWVNIKRLSDFSSLLDYSGSRSKKARTVANHIDEIVANNKVNSGVKDIINALDYAPMNSSCSLSKEERSQYIYRLSNTNDDKEKKDLLKKLQDSKCLDHIAKNIEKLSPSNNLFFAHVLHNQSSKILSITSNETKMYNGLGDYYFWTNNNFGYDTLSHDRLIDTYSGLTDVLEMGVTGSFKEGINYTAGLGFTYANLNSSSKDYTSNLFGVNLAGGIGYITTKYYATLDVTYLLGFFSNDRKIDFLNNDYSVNKSTVSSSTSFTHSFALKGEIGTEYSLTDKLSIIPSTYISLSNILGASYGENGSSGSYKYKGFFTLIPEIGINAYANYEKLMDKFLGINNIFFNFNIGLGTYALYNPSLKTSASLLSEDDNNIYFDIESDSKLGFGGQGKISINFYKEHHEFNTYINLKFGQNSYNNYGFGLVYKYLY